MLRAIITPEWAANLDEKDVWEYNTTSAETLLAEVNVRAFGGLEVPLVTPRIAGAELISDARTVRHIIDLAFGQPAVETRTGLIIAASTVQFGEDHVVTQQLRERNKPSDEHGANEPWFFPLQGVVIVDSATVPAEA